MFHLKQIAILTLALSISFIGAQITNQCFQVTTIKGRTVGADYLSDYRALQNIYTSDMELRTIKLCGMFGEFQGLQGIVTNAQG